MENENKKPKKYKNIEPHQNLIGRNKKSVMYRAFLQNLCKFMQV